ncbi:LysR family transcriptional regulator [Cognatishimia sp. WU-CL00825]|uniref:LysR family transcriptional regulator n=1 Tax=Cognatishimia sp. WU-CL00825 TaxID=3127658 RepID=UPI0031099B36
MRINYDFGDLQAFLVVKETGSFHLAAAQLNLSQSAITRRIQKLEDALGTLLFERSTRQVRPTLAAKRLQGRAEAILADAWETTQSMRDDSVAFAHQRNAVVTVALVPTTLTRIFLPALSRFQSDGAQARVQLLDGSANEVAEAVSEGLADFGICPTPPSEPSVLFDPLFQERISLALPVGHALRHEKNVCLAHLHSEPLILPAKGTGNRLLIDDAMAKASVQIPWTFEANRSSTALELVAQRLGVALLPDSVTDDPRIVMRPISDLKIARSVGLLTRNGQSETKAALTLKAMIRESV